MNNLLFVTNTVEPTSVGGREQLTRLIRGALGDVAGHQFATVDWADGSGINTVTVFEKLNGHVDGASPDGIARVIETVRRIEAKQVFLNGSNLGRVAQGVRAVSPDVQVLTFFHNCEARFFLGSLRQRPSLRSLGVLIANYRAEMLAVKYSDKIICLNHRDSLQLRKTYGRGATHILPMAMQDLLPNGLPVQHPTPSEPYALFVGGTFYANRQGIEWFVENVAAKSPIKVLVVGKGFENWKSNLERNGNVEGVGGVDSLVPWYLGASFVIAPIFDGSGMKTKVAEALMFGKRIVGTTEAFSGYEDVVAMAGAVCSTPDDFLAAMRAELSRSHPLVDPGLRVIYEQKYSIFAARARLAEILGQADNS